MSGNCSMKGKRKEPELEGPGTVRGTFPLYMGPN